MKEEQRQLGRPLKSLKDFLDLKKEILRDYNEELCTSPDEYPCIAFHCYTHRESDHKDQQAWFYVYPEPKTVEIQWFYR